MASSGRVSVLVSKELQVLLSAIRGLPKELNAQLRKHTKIVVDPVWKEAVRGNTVDHLQTRTLSDTARTAVSDSNVLLRSGGIGRTADGTPISDLALAVEFGADRNATERQTSKTGKPFTRHTKRQFKLPRSRGYVVYPAAREVIPRVLSLWFNTAVRTTHEELEKGGVR